MKKIFCLFLLFLLFPIKIYALNLNSSNAIIYDPKFDNTLYEKNSNEKVPIASLTKIMTVLVAIENIDDLNYKVLITKDMLNTIPKDASNAGLKANDIVTYEDLLYASILPSGYDATISLAINVAGSIDNFVNLMNNKAKLLSMTNTNFSNVTGYNDENNYSTCIDILKLLKFSFKNDLFKKIYTTKSYVLTNGLKINSTINKYNMNLNYDLTNIVGSKTGYTKKAGLCMLAIINVKGKEIILITLNSSFIDNIPGNLLDTLNIIDYYDKNYEERVIYKDNETLFSIPVKNSNISKYDIKLNNNIIKYINKNDVNNIYYNYNGLVKLDSNNKINDKIGNIKFYLNDNIIYEEDIVLKNNIKFSIFKYLLSVIDIIIILLSILFLIIIIKIISIYKDKKKCYYS